MTVSISGEQLQQSARPEGVFTSEGLQLVAEAKRSVGREIERVEKYGFDKEDAEHMTVLSCVRRVDQSKTYLKNYLVANIFSAIALNVILQSDDPDQAGRIYYERRGPSGTGDDRNYFDVFNVTNRDGEERANIPAPMIDQLFRRTLVEKRRAINYNPSFSHNRSFTENPNKVADMANLVGEVILQISETVDITSVLSSVFGKSSEYLSRWNELKGSIQKVKDNLMSKDDFYRSLIIGNTDYEEDN